MGKEVIGIGFWDLDINVWGKLNENNERRVNSLRVLWIIGKLCRRFKCGGLFCGELFDKGERMEEELGEICYNEVMEGFWIYGICGNDDIKKISKVGSKGFRWVYEVEKYGMMILDYEKREVCCRDKDIMVYGVGYIDNKVGVSE